MIYFTQDSGNLNIKIGYTGREGDDPAETRKMEYQTGNSNRLVVLATMPGTLRDEAILHARFAEHCAAGEWFKPVPEIIAMIARAKADEAVAAGVSPTVAALNLIARVISFGFSLRVKDGSLRISPISQLSPELREELRSAKPAIIDCLERGLRLPDAKEGAI